MQIGSTEHKELFCRSFLESHRAYEPERFALAGSWTRYRSRGLRAIPIWTMALEVELKRRKDALRVLRSDGARPAGAQGASSCRRYEEIVTGVCSRTNDPAVRLERRNQAKAKRIRPRAKPSSTSATTSASIRSRGSAYSSLACDAKILPESLTSTSRACLVEEARHIVFFINWIAWDRYRRGLRRLRDAGARRTGICYARSIARRTSKAGKKYKAARA